MIKLLELFEKLYHKDIQLPVAELTPYIGKFYKLIYSPHAKQAAQMDRYGIIDLQKIDKMMKFELKDIVEAETDSNTNKVIKVVIRKPYDKKYDIVLVLMPNIKDGTALVKTMWLNDKGDKHVTLDKSKYELK